MTYGEAVDFLYTKLPVFQHQGASAFKPTIKNIRSLCAFLDHPEAAFPSVHIAGTNGKGSVAHMLSSVLQESGFKTGLFTSPHLLDFRERIKVNGECIDEGSVIAFIDKIKPFIDDLKPSFFEVTTAMAFYEFSRQHVDIAVIETGMGGRLDATNILLPELSIITSISMDHTRFLGNTLQKIAGEKAGIIKKDTPVVIGRSHHDTDDVFNNQAEELNAFLIYADRSYSAHIKKTTLAQLILDIYKSRALKYPDVVTDLSGPYQHENIVTVIAAIEKLNEKFPGINERSLYRGLSNIRKNTKIRGRWDILGKKPLIIADSAHNEAGLKYVIGEIMKSGKDIHFVLGFTNDKDIHSLMNIFPENAAFYFCKAKPERSMAAEEVKRKALTAGIKGSSFATIKNAMDEAISRAGSNGIVFIGGSTFVVAEALENIEPI